MEKRTEFIQHRIKTLKKLKGPNEPSGPELQMMAILDNMGLKYEYEFPVRSGFILDFAILDRRIDIEVDGYYHQFRRKHDAFRNRILRRGGWTVIRIPADDLNNKPKMDEYLRALRP